MLGNFPQEEIRMLGRHRNEVEDFLTQCNQEEVKPKWSKALLNLRVQEEHLIKQKRFPAAAKVGESRSYDWTWYLAARHAVNRLACLSLACVCPAQSLNKADATLICAHIRAQQSDQVAHGRLGFHHRSRPVQIVLRSGSMQQLQQP
jgi:hypothetical protein